MDERELNYYKQLSNDLGAKVVRLQQEAARAKRETTRARTTAKLTSQLFRISSSDASGEIFEPWQRKQISPVGIAFIKRNSLPASTSTVSDQPS